MLKVSIYKYLVAAMVSLLPLMLEAQMNPDGTMTTYKRDFQYGVSLHTRGLGINTKYTIDKNYDFKKEWDIDWVASMKHAREYSFRNTGARSFVFGKKNELSVLRVTYGQQKVIADYLNSLSVRVNLHYTIGANVGILKPEYYLVSNAEGGLDEVLFDENQHFFAGQFYGAAPWARGLRDIRLVPGISGKLAMSFEWGRQDDQFKSFETGVMVDAFSTRMPIMAFTTNDFVYINLYAALSIGSRW